jgi:hypothetical protein
VDVFKEMLLKIFARKKIIWIISKDKKVSLFLSFDSYGKLAAVCYTQKAIAFCCIKRQ